MSQSLQMCVHARVSDTWELRCQALAFARTAAPAVVTGTPCAHVPLATPRPSAPHLLPPNGPLTTFRLSLPCCYSPRSRPLRTVRAHGLGAAQPTTQKPHAAVQMASNAHNSLPGRHRPTLMDCCHIRLVRNHASFPDPQLPTTANTCCAAAFRHMALHAHTCPRSTHGPRQLSRSQHQFP